MIYDNLLYNTVYIQAYADEVLINFVKTRFYDISYTLLPYM